MLLEMTEGQMAAPSCWIIPKIKFIITRQLATSKNYQDGPDN